MTMLATPALAPKPTALPVPALKPTNPCKAEMDTFGEIVNDARVYRVKSAYLTHERQGVVAGLAPEGRNAPKGTFRLTDYRTRLVPLLPPGVRGDMRNMMLATARYGPPERVPYPAPELLADLEAEGLLVKRMDGEDELTLWLPNYPTYNMCGVVGVGIER